jgi:hypothetical protein
MIHHSLFRLLCRFPTIAAAQTFTGRTLASAQFNTRQEDYDGGLAVPAFASIT